MDFSEKVEKLPNEVKDFFTSNECRFESERSFFLYGLEPSELEKISEETGMIFVGDGKLENLPDIILKNIIANQGVAYGLSYEINKRIFAKFPDFFKDSQVLLQQWERMKSNPVISEEEAQERLVKLEPWILDEEKEKIEKNNEQEEIAKRKFENLVPISIQRAILMYPRIGEQPITSGMIKLKIFPQPVRPSIKNWIEDYRSVMGAERHGMMERGNYLFHTENTKRLASGERKKLAEVLRSLDEDVTLSVDPDRQEVIFNQVEEMKPIEKAGEISNVKFPISNHRQSEIPIERDKIPQPQAGPPMAENYKRPGFSQNIPPASMRFSSPHILPSEKKEPEIPVQQASRPASQQNINAPSPEPIRHYPSFDSKAGKPWEPASTSQRRGEPKVSGNTVDLRN